MDVGARSPVSITGLKQAMGFSGIEPTDRHATTAVHPVLFSLVHFQRLGPMIHSHELSLPHCMTTLWRSFGMRWGLVKDDAAAAGGGFVLRPVHVPALSDQTAGEAIHLVAHEPGEKWVR